MIEILLAVALFGVPVVGFAVRPERRLHPNAAVPLLLWSLWVSSIATVAALALLGFGAVARYVGLAGPGSWCAHLLEAAFVLPPWLAVLGLPLTVVAVSAAVRLRRRLRRKPPMAADVVQTVVSDPEPLAWSEHTGIFLTSGLLQLLAAAEVAAVCEHERAHLRHSDLGTLAWLRLVGRFPHLRALVRAARLALERRADECAAAVHGRDVVVRALRATVTGAPSHAAAMRGPVGDVLVRLSLLHEPPSAPQRTAWLSGASLALMAVGSVALALVVHVRVLTLASTLCPL